MPVENQKCFEVTVQDPARVAGALKELAAMLESGQLVAASGGILVSPRRHHTRPEIVEFVVFSDLVLNASSRHTYG